MNIYVYNLPNSLSDKELESLFACYGEVLSAQVEKDKETGLSQSIAYVHMPIETQAQQAIVALNGIELYGKKIIVQEEGFTKGIQTFT
jgi:RNA recognition motif-containing protein